mmetsp:Transcript_1007/g.3046  ORF Transcript_1007/g.3046 Transcript_1007/m.3046 type:complete len:209 (-) Transcript_1007:64-690(-)
MFMFMSCHVMCVQRCSRFVFLSSGRRSAISASSPATGSANSVLVAGYVSGAPEVRAMPDVTPASGSPKKRPKRRSPTSRSSAACGAGSTGLPSRSTSIGVKAFTSVSNGFQAGAGAAFCCCCALASCRSARFVSAIFCCSVSRASRLGDELYSSSAGASEARKAENGFGFSPAAMMRPPALLDATELRCEERLPPRPPRGPFGAALSA